jgi:hypothetical protein
MEESRNTYGVLVGKPEGKRPLGRPSLIGNTVVKWSLKKENGREWTGLIWLGIGTDGWLL